MSRNALFSNIKVRTSLVLVLVFFVLMLLVGAALGVLSIKSNNESLQRLLRSERISTALYESIDHYKDVQALLGRALASSVVNNDEQVSSLSEWGGAKETNSLGAESIKYVDEAKTAYQLSRDAFAQFQRATGSLDRDVFVKITDAYSKLMDGGVNPLFKLLDGNNEGYHAFLSGTTQGLQDSLYVQLDQLKRNQQEGREEIQQEDTGRYKLVLELVGAGLLIALLISLLAYVFLGRIVLRPLRLAGEHFDRIAGGDLTQRVEVRSVNEIGVLYESLRRMQESLTRTVTTVRQGVQEINLGSREIFMGNTDLSSRTEEQAASLQETAASMEQLAGTVKQNTDNAQQADQLAKAASGVAQRGGAAVTAVVGTMDAISSSSGKIAEIVSVIDGIAFQTNILALNAAVEAARAGEQGRGFAVVAGEVRSLAQRSAQAAKEIKQLIEESLDTIRSGARQADQAGAIMREVVESVQGVTTIMGEISSASSEQSDGIDQVNQAVSQMDSVVQQNAALVEQAAVAAGSLQEQAARLAEAVAVFKLSANDVIDVAAPRLEEDKRRFAVTRSIDSESSLPVLAT